MKFSKYIAIVSFYSFYPVANNIRSQKTDFRLALSKKSQRKEIKKLVASEEELIKAIIKTTLQ
jgi:hypothetical protein